MHTDSIRAADVTTGITVEVDGNPYPVWGVFRNGGRVGISDGTGQRVDLRPDDRLPVVAYHLIRTEPEEDTADV
jgi:hypothetical protein